MIEKRMMKRFTLELPASISVRAEDGEKPPIDLLTNDVSGSGAFFVTGYPLPVGTEVNIDLVLPLGNQGALERKGSLIKVSGRVVRNHKGGMAICFDGHYKILPLQGGVLR
jgi:hypothetical protein